MTNDIKLLTQYLMSSYLYYIRDTSVLSDDSFDLICNQLLEALEDPLRAAKINEHPHGYIVSKDELRAGTGFRAAYRVPLMVKCAAMDWSNIT